jgi:hypothetical protein
LSLSFWYCPMTAVTNIEDLNWTLDIQHNSPTSILGHHISKRHHYFRLLISTEEIQHKFNLNIFIIYYILETTFLAHLTTNQGTRWRSWLRHCATSRKVASSIADGVAVIFYWHNPSGRTMALRSTQPLTEMSTRNISWRVKAAGA